MISIVRAAGLLSIVGLLLASFVRPGWASEEQTNVLPPDGDASANWRLAGMLSVGGIPNRSAICATVTPLGSGNDDTSNIQNAIDACPDGQVVSLSKGRFTIAEGNLILIHNAVTLRGAGPGKTTLTRKGGAMLGQR